MPELRWALIGLGLLFLVGLALWEWRKSKRRHFSHGSAESSAFIEANDRLVDRVPERSLERARRVEPSIDGISAAPEDPNMIFEVPTIHPVDPVRVALSAGSAVDVPSAARFDVAGPEPSGLPILWPREESAQVLSLRLVGARGDPLSGRTLRIALEAAGLRYGPQKIYHLTTAEGAVLASVANLVRPGSFDPALIDAQQFRGLNVFAVLPGPLPPLQMLEELTGLAHALAHRLGAVAQDAEGHALDDARLEQMRQSLDEAP